MLARVRVVSEAEDVAGRVLELGLSGKELRTPVYAVPVNYVDNFIIGGEVFSELVEFPGFYRGSTLVALASYGSILRNYDYKVNSIMSRVPEESLVVAVPLADFRGIKMTGGSLQRLGENLAARMLHPRVDFSCLPSIYNADINAVLSVVEGFIDAAAAIGKPVAPTININMKPDDWLKLIELALQRSEDTDGILLENVYCIDYGGSNPITRFSEHNIILRLITRASIEAGAEVVLYGVNVKYGRLRKGYWRRPARDLASLYMGLDIVGPNHRILPIDRNVVEPSSGARILVRKHYAYMDTTIIYGSSEYVKLLSRELGLEPGIVKGILRDPEGGLVKRANIRNAVTEAVTLQRLFAQSGTRMLRYLEGKDAMKEDRRTLTLVRRAKSIVDEVKSTTNIDKYMR